MLQDVAQRESLDTSDDCLMVLQSFGETPADGTEVDEGAMWDAARDACDDTMDAVLDHIEELQSRDRTGGRMDDEEGMDTVRFIVGEAAGAGNIRNRPCPRLEDMGDDLFATLGHISDTTRLFRAMVSSLHSEEEEDESGCIPLDQVPAMEVAYLKLKALMRSDGRLRMMMAATLNDTQPRNRDSLTDGTIKVPCPILPYTDCTVFHLYQLQFISNFYDNIITKKACF